MVGAQAISPNRPSTRRRSTRGATETRARTEMSNTRGTREARPSTRSTRGLTGDAHATIHNTPRRSGSTRKPSTRTRSSTRQPSMEQAEIRSTSTRKNRVEEQEAKRDAVRKHPVQLVSEFIFVMFFLVVVSVFAFGLLRGESTAQGGIEKPEYQSYDQVYEHKGTTSTNTGILRGNR